MCGVSCTLIRSSELIVAIAAREEGHGGVDAYRGVGDGNVEHMHGAVAEEQRCVAAGLQASGARLLPPRLQRGLASN